MEETKEKEKGFSPKESVEMMTLIEETMEVLKEIAKHKVDRAVIAVEGNIAAGKTTAIELFRRSFAKSVHEYYQENPSESFLKEFYDDQKGLADLFQFYMMQKSSWATSPHNEPKHRVCNSDQTVCRIVDRSHYGNAIFAIAQVLLGNMSRKKFKLYLVGLEEFNVCLPKLVLYICTPPAECLARKKKRGRPSESNIGIEYLQLLDDIHERFFDALESSELGVEIKRHCDHLPERLNLMIEESFC